MKGRRFLPSLLSLLGLLVLSVSVFVVIYFVREGGYYRKSTKAGGAPRKLFGEGKLKSLYMNESGWSNVPVSLAVTALEGVGDTLYLGLSKNYGLENGAMLVEYELSGEPKVITVGVVDGDEAARRRDKRISEQGLSNLLWHDANRTLVVAGFDPTDSWDWGNFYILNRARGYLEKYRRTSGLRNVVHMFRVVQDGASLYAGVGSYPKWPSPNSSTRQAFGELWKSTNGGKTWFRLTKDPYSSSNIEDFVSDFRLMGAIIYDNKLYVVNAQSGDWELLYSDNFRSAQSSMEVNIKKVGGLIPGSRALVKYKGKLVGYAGSCNYSCENIFVLDDNNGFLVYHLPFQASPAGSAIAVVEDYLYVVGIGGGIYRSEDLEKWEKVYSSSDFDGHAVRIIYYWSDLRKLLISAGYGDSANVWIVDKPDRELCRLDITGEVYKDNNGNGKFDNGEEKLDNASIKFSGVDVDDKVEVRSDSGMYLVKSVKPGLYSVSAEYRDKFGSFRFSKKNVDLREACHKDVPRHELPLPLRRNRLLVDLSAYTGLIDGVKYTNGVLITGDKSFKLGIKNVGSKDVDDVRLNVKAVIVDSALPNPVSVEESYKLLYDSDRGRTLNSDIFGVSLKVGEKWVSDNVKFPVAGFADYGGKYLCYVFKASLLSEDPANNFGCVGISKRTPVPDKKDYPF